MGSGAAAETGTTVATAQHISASRRLDPRVPHLAEPIEVSFVPRLPDTLPKNLIARVVPGWKAVLGAAPASPWTIGLRLPTRELTLRCQLHHWAAAMACCCPALAAQAGAAMAPHKNRLPPWTSPGLGSSSLWASPEGGQGHRPPEPPLA